MGQFIRCGVAVLGLVVAASAAQGAPPPKAIQPSTAIHQQTLLVAGLQKAARVVIDHWGIAHIFAASAHDAFFVQGYNAARDRLWQIDLWRKRGLGLLAKSFGAAYVDQDRATRLF
ncbi:MAG: penicillin acylase family protein, partial [Alphaproteobacteria bacterium]|nr:penicillin acylase family protein [Alphaproteobacteria bacterium]